MNRKRWIYGSIILIWLIFGCLISTPEPAPTATETPTQEVVIPPTATPTEDPYAGWLTYVSAMYGYQISYPPNASISFAGVSGFDPNEVPAGMDPGDYLTQLQQTYGDELCVTIMYSLGYISISPPENEDFHYALCGRTGVGVGTMVDKTENVLIGNQSYTAEGFEWLGGGETLDLHNETMVLHLPDGTRIEYSSTADSSATFQDYLTNTRPTLLQILGTFAFTP
jgi:hypothetical protein